MSKIKEIRKFVAKLHEEVDNILTENSFSLNTDSKSLEMVGVFINEKTAIQLLNFIIERNSFNLNGHITIDDVFTVEYKNAKLNYEQYGFDNRRIFINDNILKLENSDSIKFFISSMGWIDFHIKKGDNIITLVFSPKPEENKK